MRDELLLQRAALGGERGIRGQRVLQRLEPRLDLVARRMRRVGGDRLEQLLEPADELVEDFLVDELRQPPRALLVDAHAKHHAIVFELRAAERDELVDDEIGALARRQHLEHAWPRRD